MFNRVFNSERSKLATIVAGVYNMNTTLRAVERYEAAMLEHSNEAKFCTPSKVNCKVCELPNYVELKADYEAAFAELASREIDGLTRNELALLKCVSHGSIKTSAEAGKSAYDILTGVKAARINSIDSIVAKANADPEYMAALLAKLGMK